MKKFRSIILSFIIMAFMLSTANAAGYTLPEKMERQLQVGSGLKGSFSVYANADPELCPLLHSVQNAEFEIRGIRYEGNQHVYIYQAGTDETLRSLTEYCKIGGREYLRSDFLPDASYLLPTADSLINRYFKSEGENPSVFPDLLRLFLAGRSETALNTDTLERQIEMMISAFSTEPSIQSVDGSPRLHQTFRIPLSDVYRTVTELIRTVSSDETYMAYFREFLSQEQIDTYLNPDLGYYYIDAMNQLNMEEDIVFSRTVSTLGDLIQSSLVLPMDTEKTGYSSVTLQNSETRRSILFSGPRGVFYLDLPLDFDLNGDFFENREIRFVSVSNENEKSDNVALKIIISGKSEKYDNAEDNRIHEKNSYTLQISRDTEGLPEEIKDELIPDMASANAEIVVHWSSKSQLSSPTTLEISCSVEQGKFSFDLNGAIKTSSPWTFSPFDITNPLSTENYEIKDFDELKKIWISNAENGVIHISAENDFSEIPAELDNASGAAAEQPAAENEDISSEEEPDETESSENN